MRNSNPREDMEAEGLPEVEDRPPGIDIETDQDAMMVPRDHPVAAGGDPAYPVTAAEERTVEGVAERAMRENPDFGAEEMGVGGGVQGSRAATEDDPAEAAAVPADPSAAPGPEELAMRVRSDEDEL